MLWEVAGDCVLSLKVLTKMGGVQACVLKFSFGDV